VDDVLREVDNVPEEKEAEEVEEQEEPEVELSER